MNDEELAAALKKRADDLRNQAQQLDLAASLLTPHVPPIRNSAKSDFDKDKVAHTHEAAKTNQATTARLVEGSHLHRTVELLQEVGHPLHTTEISERLQINRASLAGALHRAATRGDLALVSRATFGLPEMSRTEDKALQGGNQEEL